MVIFTITAGVVFGFLFVSWSQSNLPNLLLRVLFFGMMMWAVVIGLLPIAIPGVVPFLK